MAVAEAVFETTDIRIYNAEAWAKYAGAADYEQEHHRDFLNHTPLVPSNDWRSRGLEIFVWLHDVSEIKRPDPYRAALNDSGSPSPASWVPPRGADPISTWPRSRPPDRRGRWWPTARIRSTEVLPSPLRQALDSACISAFVTPTTTGPTVWAGADRSYDPSWKPFAERASVRQLLLFGIPPPGHPYWTEETLAGIAVRYPAMDLTPWSLP